MKSTRLALALTLLMTAAAIGAYSLRPTQAKSSAPKFVLEQLVPTEFGAWRVADGLSVLVVNPQTQQRLDKLYSQLLTRTYASADGYHIMLSIAYGDDQRAGRQVHMPEVCYPAQGFTINRINQAVMTTLDGPINVTRLEAQAGTRIEPITYWITLGGQTVGNISRFDRRIEEFRFALSGEVPDGLLFRVSSIDSQGERAFTRHEQFVADLLAALKPAARVHLIGTSTR